MVVAVVVVGQQEITPWAVMFIACLLVPSTLSWPRLTAGHTRTPASACISLMIVSFLWLLSYSCFHTIFLVYRQCENPVPAVCVQKGVRHTLCLGDVSGIGVYCALLMCPAEAWIVPRWCVRHKCVLCPVHVSGRSMYCAPLMCLAEGSVLPAAWACCMRNAVVSRSVCSDGGVGVVYPGSDTLLRDLSIHRLLGCLPLCCHHTSVSICQCVPSWCGYSGCMHTCCIHSWYGCSWYATSYMYITGVYVVL